jgi:flagellar biosynthesis protein FlhG
MSAVRADIAGGDQASRLRALMGASLGPAPVATAGSPLASALGAPVWRGPRTLTITSGKGGVGKSNLAVNLCVALAQRGARALLMDLDLGLANADVLCGLAPRARVDLALDGSVALHKLAVDAPGGFKLIPGSVGLGASLGQMIEASEEKRERLLAQGRELAGHADVIVLDTGAGIGPMVRACVRAADVCLVVVTPEPTSLADAYALIKSVHMASRKQGGPLGERAAPRLVVNQVQDEGEARAVASRVSQVSERFLGQPVQMAGWVPLDAGVVRAVRARTPFVLHEPACGASAQVRRLAGDLLADLDIDLVEAPDGDAITGAEVFVGGGVGMSVGMGGGSARVGGFWERLSRLVAGRV